MTTEKRPQRLKHTENIKKPNERQFVIWRTRQAPERLVDRLHYPQEDSLRIHVHEIMAKIGKASKQGCNTSVLFIYDEKYTDEKMDQ